MIPPHELKNKEFTRVMRGYSIPEVDEYIAFVMEKYTDLYRENDALERKLQAALDNLEEMREEEQSIRTALINAQKTGKKIVSDANERADKIMRSAKSDCMRVLAEFRDKTAAERKTLTELKTSVAALKKELFEKYQQHIEFIEQLTPNAEEEAAAIAAIDSDTYADKLAEGIEGLIREDYGVDIRDVAAGAATIREEGSDTLVFGRIGSEPPKVQHVAIEETLPEQSAQTAEKQLSYDDELETLASELPETEILRGEAEDSYFGADADTGTFDAVK